jgi:hypothetical protein
VTDFIRIGGIQYNWNSTMSRVDGQPYRGFTEINWSEKLDVETIYSQTQDGAPIGGTSGQYAVDSFTVKMLWEYWEQLTDYLSFAAPGVPVGNRGLPGSYGLTVCTFQLSASEPLQLGALPIMLTAGQMRFIAPKGQAQKGNAGLEIEIGCWAQSLIINGKTLYSAALPTL